MHTLCEDETTANVLKQLHFIVISALSDLGSHVLHVFIKLITELMKKMGASPDKKLQYILCVLLIVMFET